MRLRDREFGPVLLAGRKIPAFWKKTDPSVTMCTPLLGEHARSGKVSRKVFLGAGVVAERGSVSVLELNSFLQKKELQRYTAPFFISCIALGATQEKRLSEWKHMADILQVQLQNFQAPVGLLLHFSSELQSQDGFEEEVRDILTMLGHLPAALVPVLSILVPPSAALSILALDECDAVMVSAPVPWNSLSIEAKKVFFRTEHPLFRSSSEAVVSGKYLLPLVAEWIGQLRRYGRKPIIAAQCVLRPRDVLFLKNAGASGIQIDRARTLRPWNVRRIICRGQKLFSS